MTEYNDFKCIRFISVVVDNGKLQVKITTRNECQTTEEYHAEELRLQNSPQHLDKDHEDCMFGYLYFKIPDDKLGEIMAVLNRPFENLEF